MTDTWEAVKIVHRVLMNLSPSVTKVTAIISIVQYQNKGINFGKM